MTAEFKHPYEFTLIGTNSKGDMEVMENARGNAKGVAAAMRAAADLIDPDPMKSVGEDIAKKWLGNMGFGAGGAFDGLFGPETKS